MDVLEWARLRGAEGAPGEETHWSEVSNLAEQGSAEGSVCTKTRADGLVIGRSQLS